MVMKRDGFPWKLYLPKSVNVRIEGRRGLGEDGREDVVNGAERREMRCQTPHEHDGVGSPSQRPHHDQEKRHFGQSDLNLNNK